MASAYITRGNTHIFWHAELSCSYRPVRRRNRITALATPTTPEVQSRLTVPKEEREVRRVDSANLRADVRDVVPVNKNAMLQERRRGTVPEEPTTAPAVVAPTPSHSLSPAPVPASSSSTTVPPAQVLKFLLSDAGLESCGLGAGSEVVQDRGRDTLTYSQLMSPYEELLSAVILSRTGSHELGLETIRTVLNPPYGFRSPVAIKIAGPQKVLQAVSQAQHKEKSQEEIEFLAEAIFNNNWHNDLVKLRRQAKGGAESEREVLRRSIKGLGKNGLDIFYRRIQWLWKETFPYVDSRTQASLEKLGLPKRPEGLIRMIETRWDELRLKDQRGNSSEEKKRRAFVFLLERAVSADQEAKIDEVLAGASKMAM